MRARVDNKEQSFYLDATSETLKNITNNQPNVAKPVYAHNLVTNVVTFYTSVTEAKNKLNIHHDFINKHLDKDTEYISIDKTRKYKFTSKNLIQLTNLYDTMVP
nr:hypothetical protein [Rhizoctonia sp.]